MMRFIGIGVIEGGPLRRRGFGEAILACARSEVMLPLYESSSSLSPPTLPSSSSSASLVGGDSSRNRWASCSNTRLSKGPPATAAT